MSRDWISLSEPASSPLSGLVGQSAGFLEVLRQVALVAPTDSTVLILGETGTGKELVAKAVHVQSVRFSQPFVKVNCSALPTSLLESELFGHEKGAFTGAVARRKGRFELADRGTLFLDEIGELPFEVQPKLLRLLQERQFERVGSSLTLEADVRLIAATQQDLASMCEAQTFRKDLYYRLNVFPIRVPPLRERRDDVEPLVRHFVPRFARRMNKRISALSARSLQTLVEYDWPGNVRELENLIERAVILCDGPLLEVSLERPPGAASSAPPPSVPPGNDSLEAVNRAHILSVLRSTNGVVAGPNGAAARLGLKRSTLTFRMKKLGIPSGPSYRAAAEMGITSGSDGQ